MSLINKEIISKYQITFSNLEKDEIYAIRFDVIGEPKRSKDLLTGIIVQCNKNVQRFCKEIGYPLCYL